MWPIKLGWLRGGKSKVLWKLTLINSLVIGMVIWVVGFSVKEFACSLVEQSSFADSEQSQAFNRDMQSYLLNASLSAAGIAAGFHYYFTLKLFRPMRQLTVATQKMAKGDDPQPIAVTSRDEIGQLTENFNHMMKQLKRTEEKRNQLTRNVAHELRTPLTNINGYLEALSTGVLQGDRDIYASLYEESKRLTRLVDQLHQMNVWESEDTPHPPQQAVSVPSVVEASVHAFRMAIEKHHMTCDVQLEQGNVRIDPDSIKQIADNLIKNAIQYDRGGWMNVEGKVVHGEYRLSVTNLGQPIPAAQVDGIFDRFTRADTSRSRHTGGAGLGLSIVKEIVGRHGGHVELVTRDDVHTFSVWFPLHGNDQEIETP